MHLLTLCLTFGAQRRRLVFDVGSLAFGFLS
jgi:hypothetical protein